MIETLLGLGVLAGLAIAVLLVKAVMVSCAPNQVLVIAGAHRNAGGKRQGYRLVRSGSAIVVPWLEKIFSLDLTTIVVDVHCQEVRCRESVPLDVCMLLGIKVTSNESALHVAVERLLGKSRLEIAQIARSLVDARTRSILAAVPPESVMERRAELADRLARELLPDLAGWGLSIDTLKISEVKDVGGYLQELERKAQAERISDVRVQEAKSRALAAIRSAENLEIEAEAMVASQMEILQADAERRRKECGYLKDAAVAAEIASAQAKVALSKAELEVQRARSRQMQARLEAEIIVPARAAALAAEAQAKARAAAIEAVGVAKADALRTVAQSWKEAGVRANDAMMIQRLEEIVGAVSKAMSKMGDEPSPGFDYSRLENPVGSNEPVKDQPEQSLSFGYPKPEK